MSRYRVRDSPAGVRCTLIEYSDSILQDSTIVKGFL